jgi:hypothetical protein
LSRGLRWFLTRPVRNPPLSGKLAVDPVDGFSPDGISYLTVSYPMVSYPMVSYPMVSYPIHPMVSYPMVSYPIHPMVSYPAGWELMEEGSRGSELYAVCDGSLEVIVGGDLVTDIVAGQVVGELSCVLGSPRTATIVASSRVLAAQISREDLEEALRYGRP